jgi:hypothetical protein
MSTVVDPDTGEQQVAPAPERGPESAAAETPTCPSCGAPADRGQLMCLECGNRLALDYRRPPGWRIPAAVLGLVLLIAGIGVAIALVAPSDNANKTTAAAPAAGAPATAASTPQPGPTAPADTPPTASTPTPAPTTSGTTTTPSTGGAATPTGTTPTPTPAPTAPATSGWPPGKSAFTVILASMPSRAAADDKLAKARAAGITGAAILHSDDFPTLKPGYWVVFDGQYDSMAQAQSQGAADRGKGEFTDAYPRFVSKDANAKP